MNSNNKQSGKIVRVAGPVASAIDMPEVKLNDVVLLGEAGLISEVIRIRGERAVLQVYEETSGVRVGEQVRNTGQPLVAHLGPGLLGRVFDGLQRPLDTLAERGQEFLRRGVDIPALSSERRWQFTPALKSGTKVDPGDILGTVQESQAVEHRILVPPGRHGQVASIEAGDFTVEQTIAVLENEDGEHHEIRMHQRWPVRKERSIQERLDPRAPLVTGTRVIDGFFPVARGGSAIIPGGFGTGKTVALQSLSRWSDVDVVVYVGCGERGNEMAELLEEFPKLEDPRTGKPLMNRTVLIANTSNMPVAAREASIYTGMTIAEYYRDMGHGVMMVADSTSRWAEALREISGLLEEMPGEEGYPAYLAGRLAEFYERTGRVICQGSPPMGSENGARVGSVTLVGAVSPPGGDFSEPVTQNSMRVAGTFWALDTELSRRRHFPAINWNESYSLYNFKDWYKERLGEKWNRLTEEAMALLERENELQNIVELVGPDALSEIEQSVLFVATMLREDFLQQSAFHEIDRYSPLEKTYWMLKVIMNFYRLARQALEAEVPLDEIKQMPEVTRISEMKSVPIDEAEPRLSELLDQVQERFAELQE